MRFFAKHALVPAGELAGVQRDRGELALADANFDATADEVRVQRVVVGVEPDVRIGRHPRHPAAVEYPALLGQRRASPRAPRASRSTGRARSVLCVRALAFSNHAVELQLEVEMVREPPARLEVASPGTPAAARRTPFACGSAGSQKYQSTGSCPQNAA